MVIFHSTHNMHYGFDIKGKRSIKTNVPMNERSLIIIKVMTHSPSS